MPVRNVRNVRNVAESSVSQWSTVSSSSSNLILTPCYTKPLSLCFLAESFRVDFSFSLESSELFTDDLFICLFKTQT